jgi:hypothetical protein
MRYELLLQPAVSDQPLDLAALEQALLARGGALGEAKAWKLKAGEVELGQFCEGGKPVALEVKVPLSDKVELLGEALKAAAELAQSCSLKLVDPQLGRVVGEKDDAAVCEQFLRTARYAGEMVGLSEAVGASFQAPSTGVRPMTKVLIGLGAILVLLYWVVDLLGNSF